MRSQTLQQEIDEHNNKVQYRKTLSKTFIRGMIVGIPLGALIYAVLIANSIVQ